MRDCSIASILAAAAVAVADAAFAASNASATDAMVGVGPVRIGVEDGSCRNELRRFDERKKYLGLEDMNHTTGENTDGADTRIN